MPQNRNPMIAMKEERLASVLGELRERADTGNVAGMARFGITTDRALGISVTELRRIARRLGRDHELAMGLWESGIHEARILAALVAEPEKVTRSLMNAWVRKFDSWDVCDLVCANLFDRVPWASATAREWSGRRGEFVKRAGFALMAALAWHNRDAPDDVYLEFLPIIERESDDDRNFVRKAVNWALRQIGKRNVRLNREAVAGAERVLARDTKAARWIARDALRELTDPKTLARIRKAPRGPTA